MTIEEIRTASIMALYQSNKDMKTGVMIPDIVDKQSKIVGKIFGNKFLLSCLREAQDMKINQEKFDLFTKKYEIVGNKFCSKPEEVEDEELYDLFLNLKGLEEDV